MSDPFDPTVPELTTPRLRLRCLTVDDAPAIFPYVSDPEVARYTLWRVHKSVEYTRDFLRLLIQPALLCWALMPSDAETVVGMVFLHSFSRYHRKAELGFSLSRAHWGKGFGTEGARAVLDYAFGDLRLNRVEATCMPENVAARAVVLKLGMSFEGRMRKAHYRHDGHHDMDLFSILRGEWVASRAAAAGPPADEGPARGQ